MTKAIAIRVKTPKARIPGSHGAMTLMLGIGSIHPLDQNAQRSLFATAAARY